MRRWDTSSRSQNIFAGPIWHRCKIALTLGPCRNWRSQKQWKLTVKWGLHSHFASGLNPVSLLPPHVPIFRFGSVLLHFPPIPLWRIQRKTSVLSQYWFWYTQYIKFHSQYDTNNFSNQLIPPHLQLCQGVVGNLAWVVRDPQYCRWPQVSGP